MPLLIRKFHHPLKWRRRKFDKRFGLGRVNNNSENEFHQYCNHSLKKDSNWKMLSLPLHHPSIDTRAYSREMVHLRVLNYYKLIFICLTVFLYEESTYIRGPGIHHMMSFSSFVRTHTKNNY